jgi:eukaryotic-like serine/threonine-protein kinase
MNVAAGTRLGPYEIVGLLGAGGMGEVYKARDPRIGREVAIKVLPPAFAADKDRLRRFQQEARAAGALNHPNLVALYDVGTSDVGPYLVSELLDGEPLRDRLRAGPVSFRDALNWTAQIAQGLSAAHGRGVVHRDLKPENVFLLRDGRAKILDFGLAKVEAPFARPAEETATSPVAVTEAGIAMGTVGYMAPEQVRGEPIGPAADIFALGTVLYELVAGRHPFRCKTSVETLNAILNENPAPLSSAPPGLDRVIARCLEKDPENRFQSAADVAFALDAVSGPVASPRPRGSVAKWLAVVAVSVLIIGALWLVTRDRGKTATLAVPAALTSVRMTPFLSSEAIEEQPAWSPTGDLIAYVSDAAGNDDVWIADTSGGNPVNLTQGFSGEDAWPAWSPDGRSVAFYSEREGGGIYTMTALGSGVRRVVPEAGSALRVQPQLGARWITRLHRLRRRRLQARLSCARVRRRAGLRQLRVADRGQGRRVVAVGRLPRLPIRRRRSARRSLHRSPPVPTCSPPDQPGRPAALVAGRPPHRLHLGSRRAERPLAVDDRPG